MTRKASEHRNTGDDQTRAHSFGNREHALCSLSSEDCVHMCVSTWPPCPTSLAPAVSRVCLTNVCVGRSRMSSGQHISIHQAGPAHSSFLSAHSDPPWKSNLLLCDQVVRAALTRAVRPVLHSGALKHTQRQAPAGPAYRVTNTCSTPPPRLTPPVRRVVHTTHKPLTAGALISGRVVSGFKHK